jgi:hypothetical protein
MVGLSFRPSFHMAAHLERALSENNPRCHDCLVSPGLEVVEILALLAFDLVSRRPTL